MNNEATATHHFLPESNDEVALGGIFRRLLVDVDVVYDAVFVEAEVALATMVDDIGGSVKGNDDDIEFLNIPRICCIPQSSRESKDRGWRE